MKPDFIVKIKVNRKKLSFKRWCESGGHKKLCILRINKGLNVKHDTLKKYNITLNDIILDNAHEKVKQFFSTL